MVLTDHEKGFVFHSKCSVILLGLGLFWFQVKEGQFKQRLEGKNPGNLMKVYCDISQMQGYQWGGVSGIGSEIRDLL